jgi:NADPH2:quinone reductase
VLEDVPDLTASAGTAVIAVKAVGVNYPDVLIIEDRYQFKPPRPFAPGGEIAGIVKSVGVGVTNVKVGDRVLGTTGWGGMAEEIRLDAPSLIALPDAMAFDTGAGFLMTYGTSYYALKDRGRARPGETLLVLGAAGGVGLAAVQLGKAMGLRVIGAVSSQEKLELVLKHGADSGVVYERGPLDKDGQKQLTEQFKTACGANGADLIYDAVGGDYAEAALRAIAWEGRFLVVGFPAGIPKIPLNLALLKSCAIVGVFWGAAALRDPEQHRKSVSELLCLHAEGKIQPHVSRRFPLERAADAITHLASRKAMGKVVVTVS